MTPGVPRTVHPAGSWAFALITKINTNDSENILAKILRGEIPNATVIETDHTLAFRDITPQAPHHVLVIPKGPYVCFDHFALEASDAEILDFNRKGR